MLKNALVIAVLALGGAAVFASCSSKSACSPGASHCACKDSAPFCNTGLSCLMNENICVSMGTIGMMGLGGMDQSGGGGTSGGSKGGTSGGFGGTSGGKGGTSGGKGGAGGSSTPETCTSTAD